MFYEEKVEGGQLWTRCTPNGEWRLDNQSPKGKAIALMYSLSMEDRLTVMNEFCHGCGTDRHPCHCTNDE